MNDSNTPDVAPIAVMSDDDIALMRAAIEEARPHPLRPRLLVVAKARLRNRPDLVRIFEHEHTVSAVCGFAALEAVLSEPLILDLDSKLCRIVDDWTERWEAPHVAGKPPCVEPLDARPEQTACPAPSASAPTVAPPKPAATATQAETVPGAGIVRHALKSRRDPLAAVFARAKQEATDSACPHSVWAALVAMATGSAAPPELTDYREDKGIQATGARGGWLSKSAFMDRWRRGTV